MFDLDAADQLPDYELKFQGQTHTYDTILIVNQFASKLKGKTDPADIRNVVNEIFGLSFSTVQALQVMQSFEEYADKFEGLLKNFFGRTQSSSTTTGSDPVIANGSQPDNGGASS